MQEVGVKVKTLRSKLTHGSNKLSHRLDGYIHLNYKRDYSNAMDSKSGPRVVMGNWTKTFSTYYIDILLIYYNEIIWISICYLDYKQSCTDPAKCNQERPYSHTAGWFEMDHPFHPDSFFKFINDIDMLLIDLLALSTGLFCRLSLIQRTICLITTRPKE